MRTLRTIWWKRTGVFAILTMGCGLSLLLMALLFGQQASWPNRESSLLIGGLTTGFLIAWSLASLDLTLQEYVEMHEAGVLIRRRSEALWVPWLSVVKIVHRPSRPSLSRIVLDDGRLVYFFRFGRFFKRSRNEIIEQVVTEFEHHRVGPHGADEVS